jgi:hypothetical protein
MEGDGVEDGLTCCGTGFSFSGHARDSEGPSTVDGEEGEEELTGEFRWARKGGRHDV